MTNLDSSPARTLLCFVTMVFSNAVFFAHIWLAGKAMFWFLTVPSVTTLIYSEPCCDL